MYGHDDLACSSCGGSFHPQLLQPPVSEHLDLFQKRTVSYLKPLWTESNPWAPSVLYSGDTSKGKAWELLWNWAPELGSSQWRGFLGLQECSAFLSDGQAGGAERQSSGGRGGGKKGGKRDWKSRLQQVWIYSILVLQENLKPFAWQTPHPVPPPMKNQFFVFF